MKTYDAERERTGRLEVGIAEYAVTTEGATLATSGLGSCVGIALRDAEAGVAGLAHVMLPASDGRSDGGAKYADTGVDALISAMEARGADRSRIVAKIAGGSDMLEFSGAAGEVGRRNVEAVREALEAAAVPVAGDDVGGEHGRTLAFDPGTGDLHVRTATDGDRTV